MVKSNTFSLPPSRKQPVTKTYSKTKSKPVNLRCPRRLSEEIVERHDEAIENIFKRVKASSENVELDPAVIDAVNSMIVDLFERLVLQASTISFSREKRVIGAREILDALTNVLEPDGSLTNHCLQIGQESVEIFTSFVKNCENKED